MLIFIKFPLFFYFENLFLYTPLTDCVCRVYPKIAVDKEFAYWLLPWYQTASYSNRHLFEQAVASLSILARISY